MFIVIATTPNQTGHRPPHRHSAVLGLITSINSMTLWNPHYGAVGFLELIRTRERLVQLKNILKKIKITKQLI